MDRVDTDRPAVLRPVRMQVAAGRDRIGRIGIETPDLIRLFIRQVIQIQLPAVVIQRIGVGHHPFSVGGIGAMAVAGEDILRNQFRLMSLVGVKVILPAVGVAVGEVDDVIVVGPGVVAAHQFQVQRPDFGTVPVGGEHVGNNVIDILTEGEKAKGNDNQQEVILANEFISDGTTMQSIPSTATGNASRAHPKNYYTLGVDQTVTASFSPKYNGEAKLVAYLGGADSSASKLISNSIAVEFDGSEIEIDPELSFADVGFGKGDSRTYYSAVQLATVDVTAGSTDVTVIGISDNLNIGALALIPLEKLDNSSDDKPAPVGSKGCGGSIVGSISLISLVAISGTALLFFKKRKED